MPSPFIEQLRMHGSEIAYRGIKLDQALGAAEADVTIGEIARTTGLEVDILMRAEGIIAFFSANDQAFRRFWVLAQCIECDGYANPDAIPMLVHDEIITAEEGIQALQSICSCNSRDGMGMSLEHRTFVYDIEGIYSSE